MYSSSGAIKPLTIIDLANMKRQGQKITCLTAYDASFASVLDEAEIDVLLVGDSLGSVIQGYKSTIPVSVDNMVYHSRCVSAGCRRAFIISDMPFASYTNPKQALVNAARLVQEGNARMVKLEGGRHRAEIVASIVKEGIPVCAHLGLLPQSINQLGGYRVQGKDSDSAGRILEDANILQDAGANLLVLECIPANLARKISQALTIPTIGIGAGNHCAGQVLVLYDMLGISLGKRPGFSKNFLESGGNISGAVKAFARAVREGRFPGEEHTIW